MATPAELLRQIPLFADLTEAHIQELASRCRRRKFSAQVHLFHEGDHGSTLYIVISGAIDIQSITDSGEVVHIASRGPSEFIGELALLDNEPRMADALTATDTEVLMLERNDFVGSIEKSPRIALSVMVCLARRLRQAAQQLTQHQELDVMGRVSNKLLDLLQQHGREEPGGGKRITLHFTQQQLAEQTGTTRSSANRALARLKAVKAIRADGRQIIVLNERKLRAYSAA